MTKKTFLRLAFFTLVGFSLIGHLIMQSQTERTFGDLLFSGSSLAVQFAVGSAFGIISALAGWKIIELDILKPVRVFFSTLIQKFELTLPEILFVSLCAGIGEEILFRGALQPIFGLWITSIGFVALHGYLNPKNWRLSVYGAFMTFVIAGIGFLKIEYGLVSAICAHTAIDMILLYKLSRDEITEETQLDIEK